MKRAILIIVIALLPLFRCSSDIRYQLAATGHRTYTGLEVFLHTQAGHYKGKKAILVTNHSGLDFNFEKNVTLLRNAGIDIIMLLAPEHGLYGFQNEYDENRAMVEPHCKLTIYNMHKLDDRSLRALLEQAQVVLFDIQDMGMRCYTYISNLKFIMDNLRGSGIPLVVLDRPNPLAFLRSDGAYLETPFISKFVSAFPAPFLYDMTIGEAARYYRGTCAPDVLLDVVPLVYYDRYERYNETGLPWIPPSPNLPTYESAIIYSGIVLLEGINLSLGRGTAKPFEYIGAPWIDPERFCTDLATLKLRNFRFRPVYFQPSFTHYQGEACGGAQIFYTGGRFSPTETAYRLIDLIKRKYPQFQWRKAGGTFNVDFLAGTDKFRKSIDAGLPYEKYYQLIEEDVARYKKTRSHYLLYR